MFAYETYQLNLCMNLSYASHINNIPSRSFVHVIHLRTKYQRYYTRRIEVITRMELFGRQIRLVIFRLQSQLTV